MSFLPCKPWLDNTPHALSTEGAEEAYLRGSFFYSGLLRPTVVFLLLFEDPANAATVLSSTTCLLSSWPLPGQRKERKGVARDLHTQKTFNKSPQLCFLHCVHGNTHKMRICSLQKTTGISCSCTVYINWMSLLKGKSGFINRLFHNYLTSPPEKSCAICCGFFLF